MAVQIVPRVHRQPKVILVEVYSQRRLDVVRQNVSYIRV